MTPALATSVNSVSPDLPNLRQAEYASLRATIRERGTVRIALIVATVAVWAGVVIGAAAAGAAPLEALVALLVLACGFEAVNALHVTVERLGRYLQVFYEEPGAPEGPSWETAAMAYGRQFPSSGPDPLFSGVFIVATLANFTLSALAGVPVERVALGGVHLVFIARILIGRHRASSQRATDLERFRQIGQTSK